MKAAYPTLSLNRTSSAFDALAARMRSLAGALVRTSGLALGLACLIASAAGANSEGGDSSGGGFACAAGDVHASGPTDPALFSREASRDVRAEWCERYDQFGRATREGPYRERHRDGSLRAEGRYKASQLEGPIVAYHENGSVFLKGFLAKGEWQGSWTLHHSTGTPWIEAELSEGRLDGAVRTRHPDGGLAGETRFQNGREDGLARSFYPTKIGGGLLSEVRVEADEWIGTHRVFTADGDALLPIDRDDPVFATVPIESMGSAPRPVGVGIAGSMSISPVTSPAALATKTE